MTDTSDPRSGELLLLSPAEGLARTPMGLARALAANLDYRETSEDLVRRQLRRRHALSKGIRAATIEHLLRTAGEAGIAIAVLLAIGSLLAVRVPLVFLSPALVVLFGFLGWNVRQVRRWRDDYLLAAVRGGPGRVLAADLSEAGMAFERMAARMTLPGPVLYMLTTLGITTWCGSPLGTIGVMSASGLAIGWLLNWWFFMRLRALDLEAIVVSAYGECPPLSFDSSSPQTLPIRVGRTVYGNPFKWIRRVLQGRTRRLAARRVYSLVQGHALYVMVAFSMCAAKFSSGGWDIIVALLVGMGLLAFATKQGSLASGVVSQEEPSSDRVLAAALAHPQASGRESRRPGLESGQEAVSNG